MSKLNLYSIFHLNLHYSSISEEDRWRVIQKCYWPLMGLRLDFPIAIEATAYTLEVIDKLDPDWIKELRAATASGHVEFIGSGYSQIIAPLVPYKVNKWNIEIGKTIYQHLLELTPTIWYINEQAYSAGIVDNYIEQGANAIIMEWNNARTAHPEWEEGLRYWPQYIEGSKGLLPVIWNDSILFQKFQRVAHGELDHQAFIDYMRQFLGGGIRSLCLYGSDIEIFNYRPNRYKTEARLEGDEWKRIRKLYGLLRHDGFTFTFPSATLKHTGDPLMFPFIKLESAEHPILVKKQPKYNISRWAVTGKDNVRANSMCFEHYRKSSRTPRELCYLWSSDFRSHITEERWNEFQKEIKLMPSSYIRDEYDTLYVDTPSVALSLNKQKGLSINSLNFINGGTIGTIPHGYFQNDIALSPDWYSGNVTLQCPGKPQMTDLSPVSAVEVLMETDEFIMVTGRVGMDPGWVNKTYIIYKEIPQIDIRYAFQWEIIPSGSFRIANITLLPEMFDRKNLFYATHNGGERLEVFKLEGTNINQGRPASSVVSASGGLGATEGTIVLGDDKKTIWVWFDQSVCAAMPMLVYQETPNSYLARLMFSCGEMDESRPANVAGPLYFMCRIQGGRDGTGIRNS